MEADFSGYASKAATRCTDGRTIQPDAFKHQDKMRVPLVWQHGHKDIENVLGHSILENRPDGVYAYNFFNDSPKAKIARALVEHKDITQMSIWANQLIQKGSAVVHGAIKEVSLVLAGANPGAMIENVNIRHSDGEDELLEDEVIIHSGEEFEHADTPAGGDAEDQKDGGKDENAEGDDETVGDVINSMNDKQRGVLTGMVAQAIAAGSEANGAVQHNDNDQKGNIMTNAFEKGGKGGDGSTTGQTLTLQHDDMEQIVSAAKQKFGGSLKHAVEEYALAHGIENIGVLFPPAQALTDQPKWEQRQQAWVPGVINGVSRSPFAKVKTLTANITFDEARAKGYIKGNMKKEEFFAVASRETGPQTVYKKQKLDRDDIIDAGGVINLVTWVKGEMQMMLNEEIATAILIGDGREVDDDDKIHIDKIRPIADDDPYYTVELFVPGLETDANLKDTIDEIILNRQYYLGTGTPTLYTTARFIARVKTIRDEFGHRLYPSIADFNAEVGVADTVWVATLDRRPEIIGVLVNMADYNVGTDTGGEINFFDFFDIDFNQEKYLIETRFSGALTAPRTAQVLKQILPETDPVTPGAPTIDRDTWTVTVPDTAHVVYTNQHGDDVTDSDVVLAAGDVLKVTASAETGYYLPPGGKRDWSFLRPSHT